MNRGVHTVLLRTDETLVDAFSRPNRWIDHLPNVSPHEIGMLVDYLVSEFNIRLPSAIQGSEPIGYGVVCALTHDDANCLRTRLKKKVHDLSLKAILQAYGHASEGHDEWRDYFCRQSELFEKDDCTLVLLVSSGGENDRASASPQ